jgi:hypothetical protein
MDQVKRGDTLSLISFNVFGFHKIRNNAEKKLLFEEIISMYSPDLLLLQEDLLSQYPPNYDKLTGSPSIEGLMNTILVRSDLLSHVTKVFQTQRLMTDERLSVDRSATSIIFKGISICNFHLSGGKVDDVYFKEIVDLRNRQVQPFTGYDIIAGDFNGNPYDNKFALSHPIFMTASQSDQQIFKQYFKSGHKPLLEAGMASVHIDRPTDVFGGNPDHVYYDAKKLRILAVNVIDMITLDLSDHNAIYVSMKLL